jgi:molybdopterin-containing oxidoreductase family iron-sulfur binding subunit
MDGEVVSACAEACPTHAITFGDLNDQKTNNYRRSEDVRAYHALEDVGVQPNIFYLTKVRNTEADKA